MIARRAILKLAVGLASGTLAYGGLSRAAQQAAAGPQAAQPFDFAWLKGQAHWLASNAYQPSKDVLPPAMATLGYDQYQSIRFRTDHALWADAGLAFRLQFFHVGRNFTEPVHIYEVVDGQAREILYDPAMFEWDKSGVDPAMMKDRAGFAGFRVQFVTELAGRCRRVPGRQLFSRRRRRYAPVRPVGAGAGGRHRVPAARGISAVHLFLVRAAGEGLGNSHPLCAARLAEHRRRDALANRARRHADHEHRHGAVPAQADRALGHRPAHQHVLLWRKRSPHRERLAAGDPRFRRPVHVDRSRRVDLAAAGQSCAIAPELLLRRQSARIRPAAAGPQFRSLPGRRRVLRSAPEPVGGAESRPERRMGQGRGAARRNTDRGRDLRQHRGLLESARQAQARPGTAVQLPAVLGHEDALLVAAWRRPSRRAPASAAPSA